jgi:hypothetical protein
MDTSTYKNILVILSAALFMTFSMMHEFDWLIPSSPVTVSAALSPVPTPDIVEEPGTEDEIEHEESFYIRNYTDIKYHKGLQSKLELRVAQVLSPPPDMV